MDREDAGVERDDGKGSIEEICIESEADVLQ